MVLVQKELKNAYIGIPDPTSIVLNKSAISLTTVGQTVQLTATIEPEVSDKTITWSSDDTTIATVSTTGLVTCVTPGECTITATTANGLTATCSVRQSRLPSTYQEVEWIESDGSQIINTGYVTNSNIRIQSEFMITSSGSDQVLFGTTYGSWAWADCLAFRASNGNLEIGASSSVYWTVSKNLKYTLDYTLSSITLDGDTKNYNANVPGNNTLTIFYGNGKGGHIRAYSFKVYTGNTLDRDFVPCYRKNDGEIGMYDVVNDVFYTNQGSGTFTKGSDV